MRSLKHRIARLASQANGSAPCPLCGHQGANAGQRAGTPHRFRVSFAGDPDVGPDHCPACGTQRVFRIQFDDGAEFEGA